MFKLTILAVGPLKESYWKEAQGEYLRRLAPFAKIEVEEVTAEPFGGSVTAEQSMRIEGERLLRRLPEDATVVALDRVGKPLSSPEFARLLGDAGDGGGRVVLIIGGAAGLDEAVLRRATRKISLSAMTFTHEMARVFLLEQVYRAMTILRGKAYHL